MNKDFVSVLEEFYKQAETERNALQNEFAQTLRELYKREKERQKTIESALNKLDELKKQV